ncbi:hypothetical protein [Bacillus cereus]|uniref:hypothetical protein n=1 Tax=Bacillus cereus TaxID=1396 RepID=UPI00397F93B9
MGKRWFIIYGARVQSFNRQILGEYVKNTLKLDGIQQIHLLHSTAILFNRKVYSTIGRYYRVTQVENDQSFL